jgi:hypothetical protein
LVVVLSPTPKLVFSPQQYALESAVMPHTFRFPADTAVKVSPPSTSCGDDDGVTDAAPMPSVPL